MIVFSQLAVTPAKTSVCSIAAPTSNPHSTRLSGKRRRTAGRRPSVWRSPTPPMITFFFWRTAKPPRTDRPFPSLIQRLRACSCLILREHDARTRRGWLTVATKQLPKPSKPDLVTPNVCGFPQLVTGLTRGWVAEWFKATVLKTVVRGTVPWVRIPPHPPFLRVYSG